MPYANPPAGFTPLPSKSPFVNHSGRFFSRAEADGQTTVGTWVGAEQINSESVAHGGFLLAFVDFALTIVSMGVTLSMTTDFLRPAPLGSWLEAKVQIRKRSPILMFADALVETEGKLILRATGLFKPFPPS